MSTAMSGSGDQWEAGWAGLQPLTGQLASLTRVGAIAGQRAAAQVFASGREAPVGAIWHLPGHHGSPHDPIDPYTLQFVESAISDAAGYVYLQAIGEEAIRSGYIPPGLSALFVIDPLDGTLPGLHLGIGWSTVVLAYQYGEDGWRLPAASVADSNGNVITMKEDGEVVVGDLENEVRKGVGFNPSAQPPRELSIAAVGAKPSARHVYREFEQLVGDEAAVFNLGGSPTTYPLLAQRLGAAVTFGPSSPWDAINVLLASQAGLAVATPRDGLVSADTVRSWFQTPPIGPSDDSSEAAEKRIRIIPANVVAVTPSLAEDLAECVGFALRAAARSSSRGSASRRVGVRS